MSFVRQTVHATRIFKPYINSNEHISAVIVAELRCLKQSDVAVCSDKLYFGTEFIPC